MAKTKENQEKPAKGKIGLGKLILALLGIVIVSGAMTFGYLWFFTPADASRETAAKSVELATFDLGERVLNLADVNTSRYLRVHTVLEYRKNEKLAKELGEQQAQIMEKVIMVLRSKTTTEVLDVNNMENIKKDILQSVNSNLKNGKVEGIYFTDFLVQ